MDGRDTVSRLGNLPGGGARGGRRWRELLARLALVAVCLAALAGLAAATSDEDDVKTAFLYNFTKFVEWPREAFEGDSSPIVIGIAGDDALAASFADAVSRKNPGGRAVVVRRIAESGELPRCHVLFLRATSRRRISEVVDELDGQPVLLVGESEHFLSSGGMINFVLRSDRVRFDVNLDAAQKCHLKLSSKLVHVASQAYETRREGH